MPIDDVLPFLGGSPDAAVQATQGTPVQAQTADIAKRLGFPAETIDRFGDVLGARERRSSDVLRDFAIGFSANDPTAATSAKLQIQKQFNDAVDRRTRQAQQQKEADRQEAKFIYDSLESSQKLGPKIGLQVFKDIMKQANIPVAPSVAKMFTEQSDDLDAAMTWIKQAIDKDAISGRELRDIIGDPKTAAEAFNSFRQWQAQEARVGNMLLDRDRKRQLIAQGQERALNPPMSTKINEELRIRLEHGDDKTVWPELSNFSTPDLQKLSVRRMAETDPLTEGFGRVMRGETFMPEVEEEAGPTQPREMMPRGAVRRGLPQARTPQPLPQGGQPTPQEMAVQNPILSVTELPDTVK